LTLLPPVDKSQ